MLSTEPTISDPQKANSNALPYEPIKRKATATGAQTSGAPTKGMTDAMPPRAPHNTGERKPTNQNPRISSRPCPKAATNMPLTFATTESWTVRHRLAEVAGSSGVSAERRWIQPLPWRSRK